ncbi:MAG: tetraacyldisaccharide 4'-kinase [Acidobacteria bacterium]|nr:tetraacyldisaccharide 4'-kinase [Acidobacteriota bacterium]
MIGPNLLDRPALWPLLFLPGVLYRAAVAARGALYDTGRIRPARLPCHVISIGNLTVGGSGKTPLTSFIAGFLRDSGYRVGVASRGYRRRGPAAPRLVSDGRRLLADPGAAGDEPYLIARDNPSVPVAVGADRVAAARLLLATGPLEAILLDDAFQHRRIARDLDLLLVDGRDPWGNGRMLPHGPLREPLSAVTRADAVILTRSEGRVPAAVASVLERHNPRAAVLHCGLEPEAFVRAEGEPVGLASLKGFSSYVFSGIARPERFEEEVRRLGLRLAGARRFPDHHHYTRRELEGVVREARAAGAEVLVTTEKDLLRIAEPPAGALPLYALALRVTFPWGVPLQAWLLDRLAARRPAEART